jgi:hypothetical protein
MTEPVRAKLIEIQQRRGDTDEQFAVLLDISRSHWTHIRHDRRHLTYAITKRAARLFDEVRELVVEDLDAEPEAVAVAS